MSIATWKKEYVSGIRAASKDPMKALEHSIHKWEGLRKENLDRHQVQYSFHRVASYKPVSGIYDSLEIGGNSCALCIYAKPFKNPEQNDCSRCPIDEMTGKNCERVYVASDHDPLSMLDLLWKVKRKMEAKK